MMSESTFRRTWQEKKGRLPRDEDIALFQRLGVLPYDNVGGLMVSRVDRPYVRVSRHDPQADFLALCA